MSTRTLLTLVLMVVAAAAGYFGYQTLGSGAGSTAANDAPAAPAAPLMRPEFTLANLQGEPTSITQWDGQPMLVNFWATWCGPCRREIPLLQALQDEYAEQDLAVIGVAIDELDATREYIEEIQVHYAILVGEQEAADAMTRFGANMTALPYTAFVDRTGKVVVQHMGELHRDQAEAALKQIL